MLQESHREYLERRAVDPDQFNGRFRSVSGNDPALANFPPHGKRAGLLITCGDRVQLRPDNPPIVKGKPAKFISELDLPPIIDVPEQIAEDAPVAIIEGLVKQSSFALAWPEGVAVGICGCACWTVGGSGYKGFREELEALEWDGKTVYITFDADWRSNQHVNRALKALAGHLRRRGALVLVVNVPVLEGDKATGCDDYLASYPPNERQAALQRLLDDAEQLPGHGGPRARAGRPAKEKEEGKRPDSARELAFACVGSDNWTLVVDKVAHWERSSGLWTPLTWEQVGEAACYPEYLEAAKLDPAEGIRKAVPARIKGLLQFRGVAPVAPRHLWPFKDYVLDVSRSSFDAQGALELDVSDYAREHFFTGKLAYNPSEEYDGFAPRLWNDFLHTGLGSYDMVAWAERLVAYVLFGDNHWQKFLYFSGLAGSGKGVLLAVIKALMGSQHVAALNEALVWDDKPWSLLPLLRSRLVTLPESRRGLPFETLKAITGGDTLSISAKGGAPQDYVYPGHIIITSNKGLRFDSAGMERRLLTLPFKTKTAKPDPHFAGRLIALLPQIWTHLFHVWLDTKDAPLVPPVAAQDFAEDSLGGPFERWLAERVEISDSFQEDIGDLAEDYLNNKGVEVDAKALEAAKKEIRRKGPGQGLFPGDRGRQRCRLVG